MTIETGLVGFLRADPVIAAVVDARVYPLRLPQTPIYPAITYQRISTTRERPIRASAWRAQARFQVDCWADSYGVARQLGDAVRARLDGHMGDLDGADRCDLIEVINEQDMDEGIIGLYRVSLDALVVYIDQ